MSWCLCHVEACQPERCRALQDMQATTCSKLQSVLVQGCCWLNSPPRGDVEVLLPCLAYCVPADVGVVAPLLPAQEGSLARILRIFPITYTTMCGESCRLLPALSRSLSANRTRLAYLVWGGWQRPWCLQTAARQCAGRRLVGHLVVPGKIWRQNGGPWKPTRV